MCTRRYFFCVSEKKRFSRDSLSSSSAFHSASSYLISRLFTLGAMFFFLSPKRLFALALLGLIRAVLWWPYYVKESPFFAHFKVFILAPSLGWDTAKTADLSHFRHDTRECEIGERLNVSRYFNFSKHSYHKSKSCESFSMNFSYIFSVFSSAWQVWWMTRGEYLLTSNITQNHYDMTQTDALPCHMRAWFLIALAQKYQRKISVSRELLK